MAGECHPAEMLRAAPGVPWRALVKDSPTATSGSARFVALAHAFRGFVALEVEHLTQLARDRAVVGVRRHQLPHVSPPSPADLRPGDGLPPFLALALPLAAQFPRLAI